MQHRYAWPELPDRVRSAVESAMGPVRTSERVETFHTSPFAGFLTTESGRQAFAKGAPTTDDEASECLRREVAAAPIVGELAPPLLAHVEADGWNVLVFGRIVGRHADLSPGSADLPHVARALCDAQRVRLPHGVELPPLAERWAEFLTDDERALLDGNALLHADLIPENLMIPSEGGGHVHLIDWGRAAIGPPWAEFAGLYNWLLFSGHIPESAHAWLRRFPTWRAAPDAGIRVFVAANQRHETAVASPDVAAAGVVRWASLLAHRQPGRGPV